MKKSGKRLAAVLTAITLLFGTLFGLGFEAQASTISDQLSTKTVLAPGTVDDLTSDDYALKFNRSRELYGGYDAGNIDSFFRVVKNEGQYGMTAVLGNLMGIPNPLAYFTPNRSNSWAGSCLIYRVAPNSYIATSLVFQGTDIGMPENLQVCNAYGFDYSADGETWSPLEPDFERENTWTAGVSQVCSWKAVVHLPEDAAYYRVTLPGFNKEAAGTGATSENLWKSYDVPNQDNDPLIGGTCGIGISLASSYDLTRYETWAEVPEESEEFRNWLESMQSKTVLAPGKVDDLSTGDYALKFNRSRELYGGYDAGNIDNFFRMVKNEGQNGMTQVLGNLMGLPNQKAYFTPNRSNSWAGSSLVYRVAPGSYVATSLVFQGSNISEDLNKAVCSAYDFQWSADGATWTSLEPTLKWESRYTPNVCQVCAWKAVVHLPEQAAYYRVTLPGFSKEAAGTGATSENLWKTYDVPNEVDDDIGETCGVGVSLASSYDLSLYDKWEDVPAEVTDKTALHGILDRASVAPAEALAEGSAKTAFLEAYARARAVAEDPASTQLDIDAATAALTKAFGSLVYKPFSEASPELSGSEGQYAARRFLRPGIYDELRATPMVDGDGNPLVNAQGLTLYCSDYSLPGIYATQDGFNTNYYNWMVLNRDNLAYSAVSFMGKPVLGAYVALAAWSGSYVQYRVYGDSYVATALLVDRTQHNDRFPEIQKDYTYLVSKDGQTYIEVEPESLELVDSCTADDVTPINWDLYKAVVKIPADYTYYRIVNPGAQTVSPDTKWYEGNPSPGHTRIGPSFASKYDLALYENCEDVPDYTAEDRQPSLSAADESTVSVQTDILSVKKGGLTVAQVKAALTVKNGYVEFEKPDGTMAADTDRIATGMKLWLFEETGNNYYENTQQSPLLVVLYNDIYRIEPPDPIEIANGVEKTAQGLTLPETVRVYTGVDVQNAAVVWDVAACAYNPRVTQTQTFPVAGRLTLPNGIHNPLGLPLEVAVTVTVNAPYRQSVRTKEGVTDVIVDQETGTLYFQQGMTAAQLLDRLEPYGDTVYHITQNDWAKGTVVEIDASQTLTTLMGLDVLDQNGILVAYFNFEYLSAYPDLGEVPQTGEHFNLLPVWLCLLSVGGLAVWGFKRRPHAARRS